MWNLNVESGWRANFYDDIKSAIENGSKLIMIDPRRTPLAEKADLWLQMRPGTDCALALGMLNVIINEELYNKEFVEKWTTGFDELRNHVKTFTPQKVSEVTWIPAEKIEKAARMYATNHPACIGTGISGMCHGNSSFQSSRAVAILVSVTGNLDVAGGNLNDPVILKDKASMAAQYDAPFGKLSPNQIKKRLSIGKLVHLDGFMNAHPVAVWTAIREGKPYPVKALLGFGTNSVVSKENSMFIRDTLTKLDLFVIADFSMTPTAEVADIVLPAAHWSERDEVIDVYTRNYVFCHQKVVEPLPECWEDKKILIEIARKLGMEEYWKTVDESLNDRLLRLGITFEDLKKKGMIEAPVAYKKYERFGGFKTKT